jgi:hypothetical protein
MNEPSAFRVTVPFAGPLINATLSESPSMSPSFAKTLAVGTSSVVSSPVA